MILCKLCKSEGRDQVHHRFLEPEEGGAPIPVCRWHFRGIPHPSTRLGPPRSEGIKKEEAKVGGKQGTFDESKLRALHARGMTDGEIGKEFGRSGQTILKYRQRLGLPAHPRKGRPQNHKRRGSQPADVAGDRSTNPHDAPTPPASALPPSGNGTANMVLIRVEMLDVMWAQLNPNEKAQLINQLVPLEQRS